MGEWGKHARQDPLRPKAVSSRFPTQKFMCRFHQTLHELLVEKWLGSGLFVNIKEIHMFGCGLWMVCDGGSDGLRRVETG